MLGIKLPSYEAVRSEEYVLFHCVVVIGIRPGGTYRSLLMPVWCVVSYPLLVFFVC